MPDTLQNPFLSAPSQQDLESQHLALNDFLKSAGELTLLQSTYAVLLSDKLVHVAQSDDLKSPQRYYNDLGGPLYNLRQALPVVFKQHSPYQSPIMRRGEISFIREKCEDEFKAAQALSPVLKKMDGEVAKEKLQQTIGLAFLKQKQESAFMQTVEEVIGLPETVAKPLFELVRFEAHNHDFQALQMA